MGRTETDALGASPDAAVNTQSLKEAHTLWLKMMLLKLK